MIIVIVPRVACFIYHTLIDALEFNHGEYSVSPPALHFLVAEYDTDPVVSCCFHQKPR